MLLKAELTVCMVLLGMFLSFTNSHLVSESDPYVLRYPHFHQKKGQNIQAEPSKVGKEFRKTPRVRVQNNSESAVEPPLRIGSFNVQTLSKKKFNNVDVMLNVEKVIHRYDLILIMEIILQEDEPVYSFLQTVNRYAPKGVVYNVTVSSKLGGRNSSAREQYAFFYRTDKLKVLRTELYHNEDDAFFRTPFIVFFEASTLRDMKQFATVGLHAKPDRAAIEISALAQVYDFVKHMRNMEDVLIMGDLNAACTYVGEHAWNTIDLWTREEFTWPIGHNIDTTTNHRSCALDRFVFGGKRMDDGVIVSSAQVFNFKEAFGLTIEQTRIVSDHWPIEIQIRGKMSSVAENHLKTEVCVTMGDSRPVSIPVKAVLKRAKDASFSFTNELDDGFSLLNTSSTEPDMKESLQVLRKVFPDLVTSEQLQGVLYKIEHGSLEDISSFVDVQKPSFAITLQLKENCTTVNVCRKSSVN